MDFRFTPEEEAFRKEVREFLESEIPKDCPALEERTRIDESWPFLRQLSRKLGEKGWLAIAWPKEYGGQDRSVMEQLIFAEETCYRRVSVAGNTAVTIVGPVLMLYGSEEQKREYLPRIAKGEIDFCLCYSEPGAGSDLASLQCRAVEDGDDFVISGQKTFTSLAHLTEYAWLAARTDPDVPKHKGISLFIVDMKTPGITVRPLIDMLGRHRFNEVFFDEVRIPKSCLVGERNRGWYHLATALDFERTPNLAFFPSAAIRPILEDLVQFAKEVKRNGQPLAEDPVVRRKLAEMFIQYEVGRTLAYRVAYMLEKGLIPNYEASIVKLYSTELHQRVANMGMEILGLYGQLEAGSKWAQLRGSIEYDCLNSVSATIGAGTSEIQRRIIATRGLGLPRG
ncbi:MAG: acyl-CoA dehydrogenase family protein [Dehalococcoidia bacterium]